MSNVGNGVPPIEKLAHLRDRYQEDGGNRDEGVEPAVHTFIVTPHPLCQLLAEILTFFASAGGYEIDFPKDACIEILLNPR